MDNKTKNEFIEWGKTILIFIIAFMFIRVFLFTPVNNNGESMSPTLSHGDRMVVSKVTYRFSEPDRNDIIVFPYEKNEHYIKRVIGLPGEEIDLKSGYFYIDGVRLEDELSQEPTIAYGDITFPVTVPQEAYFVLGDNRNVSEDSRYSTVGFVEKDYIVGKVVFRYFPFKSVKIF